MEDYLYSGHYTPEIIKGSTRTAEQLVGHRVEIYQFGDLHWHPWDEDFLQPAGMLEKACDVDFGEVIAEIGNENVLPERFRVVKEYLLLGIKRQGNEIRYGFDVNRKAISVERPLEYRLTQYSSLDNQQINQEKIKIITLAFRKKNTLEPAGGFRLYRYVVPEVNARMN